MRLKACLSIGAFGIVFSGSMPPAAAEVFLNLKTEYYSVEINGNAPLLPQLLRASPVYQDAKKYLGNTRAQIHWNFKFQKEPSGQCRIVSNRTSLDATIVMPQIYGATERQLKLFARFYDSLWRHELGHYAVGAKTAFAIDQELTALLPMRSCRQLSETANSLGNELLRQRTESNASYDKATLHGRLQGAVLSD